MLAPSAGQNDKAGRFSTEAVASLGESGLLGLMLPADVGGSGLGPRTLAAVIATLAEADASVAMVYLMHILGATAISAARPSATQAVTPILQEIAAGRHLSTLAFSEAGSRSHFWAPVSRAHRNGNGVRISAKKSWVTSAGHAQSYVVSALSPEGAGPTDSTLYLLPAQTRGLSVAGPWDGLGLRANASAPITLEDCEVPSDLQLTDDGAGFPAMLNVVLPLFNLGTASVALGLCRAAVAGTASHLKNAKFEHLGQSLGEACLRYGRNSRRCRLIPMDCRHASTIWLTILRSRARRPCCACLSPKPLQGTSLSASPRQPCAFAAVRRSPSI